MHSLSRKLSFASLLVCVALLGACDKKEDTPTSSNTSQVASGANVTLSSADVKGLQMATSALNKGLPQMVSKGVQFDRVVFDESKTEWIYEYTLVDAEKSVVTQEKLSQGLEIGKAQSCSNNGLVDVLKKGVVIVYRYNAKDGSFIGDIRVARADCEK